jgi:ribonuclease-3
VLGLAITTHLYPRLDADQYGAGRLTQIRAQTVSGRACRDVAERLGFPDRLRACAPEGVGRNVETLLETERVLASVMEAAIGACYLNVGDDTTAAAVVEVFQPEVEIALEGSVDFKSMLQEHLARDGESVTYEVTSEEGPPHDRVFAVEARVGGESVGQGTGKAKKDAEQEAAQAALTKLEG